MHALPLLSAFESTRARTQAVQSERNSNCRLLCVRKPEKEAAEEKAKEVEAEPNQGVMGPKRNSMYSILSVDLDTVQCKGQDARNLSSGENVPGQMVMLLVYFSKLNICK